MLWNVDCYVIIKVLEDCCAFPTVKQTKKSEVTS
jgi:hypothetical protein